MWKLSVITMVFWIGSLSCLGSTTRTDMIASGNIIGIYKSLFRPGSETPDKSEIFPSMEGYITKHGYPLESHTVTTEDGYLLTVHRIPGSPKASSGGVKTPVLVMHGLFASSQAWVMQGPDRALGFLLADQGYDVWLGNNRGNTYSRNHTSLSPKDPQFWNFTWHEVGMYDLPAVIDYILDATQHTQLIYIGHSMGTTSFFVMASSRPEYNQKIRLMVALAPVVFFTAGIKSKTLLLFFPQVENVYRSATSAGIYELMHRNIEVTRLVHTFCKEGQPTQFLCLRQFSGFFGSNPSQTNKTLIPEIILQALHGSSIGAVLHYIQNMVSVRFQMFDPSGQIGTSMPEYDVTKVTCPVSLVYSLNDVFADIKDVMKLKETLPNVVQITEVADEKATHTDFVFSTYVRQMFYDGVIDFLENYKDSKETQD